MKYFFLILLVTYSSSTFSAEESCGLCYIFENSTFDTDTLSVYELIEFRTEKLGKEAFMYMDNMCLKHTISLREKFQNRRKFKFRVTNKHLNLRNYMPEQKTNFALVHRDDMTDKAATDASNLNCQTVEASKYEAQVEFLEKNNISSEERRKEQDRAHGYQPSIKRQHLKNPTFMDK